jgi:hypothetical protein
MIDSEKSSGVMLDLLIHFGTYEKEFPRRGNDHYGFIPHRRSGI